jgi:hypothetical protein
VVKKYFNRQLPLPDAVQRICESIPEIIRQHDERINTERRRFPIYLSKNSFFQIIKPLLTYLALRKTAHEWEATKGLADKMENNTKKEEEFKLAAKKTYVTGKYPLEYLLSLRFGLPCRY